MLSNKELGAYLKKLRENRNLSLRQVDYRSSVSFSHLSMIENGTRRPTALTLKELANVYNVDYIDLYEKAGYLDLAESEKLKNSVDSNIFPVTDIPKKVPVIGRISAGLPILATENIEGYEFAPSSQIKEGYTYFYLRVQGDSMNLKFNEGDIVLVQKQDDLENNEIGVILVNGFDATVKKYRKENGLVILEPMSTNPENTVQIYNPKDISIKIIGKVISYQGKI